MERSPGNDTKRILTVTAGNLRQGHVPISGHYDFFPLDCIGPARKSDARQGVHIEILLDGLGKVVRTDLPTDPRTGKPRGILRERGSVRLFYQHHGIGPGDSLALERLNTRCYRLAVERTNGHANGRKFTAAEFFAGIGLVRLALERQGWQVVFANDIDPDKAEMYRHNWPKEDHLVIGDIHKLDAKDIPTCDLFTASFPCNDLSIAGRWEGLSGKEC